MTARKFKELGASSGRNIEAPEVVDKATRLLQVQDLLPRGGDNSQEKSNQEFRKDVEKI